MDDISLFSLSSFISASAEEILRKCTHLLRFLAAKPSLWARTFVCSQSTLRRAVHKRNLIESMDPLLLSASSSEVAAPRRAVVEVVTRLITCLDKLQVVAVETVHAIRTCHGHRHDFFEYHPLKVEFSC
jgi:hypothetical protein